MDEAPDKKLYNVVHRRFHPIYKMHDREGSPIGYVLDLKNQTFQMASGVLVRAIDRQQARLELDLTARSAR